MPYRIVVADPSVSVQKAVQAVLPEPDFRVFVFEDGAELVEALPELRPDTILLGLSLRRFGRLRGRPLDRRPGGSSGRAALFLKGTFESFDPDKAEGIAFDGIFQKPFDSELLGTAIREAIDRKLSPPTMPEELLFEEFAPKPSRPGIRPGNRSAPAQPAGPGDDDVRDLVRREILDMEREIEKRVRARVLVGRQGVAVGSGTTKRTPRLRNLSFRIPRTRK